MQSIHNGLELLEQVESTRRSNEKLLILYKLKDHPNVAKLIKYALDYQIRFKVKKFKINYKREKQSDKFEEFESLMVFLMNQKARTNDSIEKVEKFLSSCDELQAKWYSRVLLKDLKCGIGITQANKVGLNVPVFDVQLAKDAKSNKKLKQIIEEGIFLSPKYDGYRCLAKVEDFECILYSRNGTEYENFNQIKEEIESYCRSINKPNLVLDGEIMSNDFNSMQQSAFASTRGTTVGDIEYHVFDLIQLEEWNAKKFKDVAFVRYRDLSSFLHKYKGNMLKKVSHQYCQNYEFALKYEKQCLDDGFEGAMINPNIPYYLGKKSNKMLKLKTFETLDCKIKDVYEGEDKYTGMLGGVVVVQPNGLECDVGSGFTDEQRKEFWNNPEVVLNRLVEIKYQELTHLDKMRFPVFKRFRDNGPEKGKR